MAEVTFTVEHPDHLPEAAVQLGIDWQLIVQLAQKYGSVAFAIFEKLINLRTPTGFDWAALWALAQQYGPMAAQIIFEILFHIPPV